MEIRKILKDKRGLGIGDLYPIILTIAVVAILLVIVMVILEEWQGATNTKSQQITNETLTTMDELGEYVANSTSCGFSNFAVVVAINATDDLIIEPGNYSINTDTGFINVTAAGALESYNESDWEVTYIHNYGGADCRAVSDIVEDYTDFIPWIGIILLVVAAAIVLGVVISSFAGRRRGI